MYMYISTGLVIVLYRNSLIVSLKVVSTSNYDCVTVTNGLHTFLVMNIMNCPLLQCTLKMCLIRLVRVWGFSLLECS